MSLSIPIITSQTSQPTGKPPPVVDPELVRKLNIFMASAKVIRFTYNSSTIPNDGKEIVFAQKSVGTRELLGEISKDQSGDAVFRLEINETDTTPIGSNQQPANRQFEADIKGAYIGLRVIGTQRVISTGAQVVAMPSIPITKWGALIVQPLTNSGTYELFLSATPIQSTTPKSATPKRKNYWEAGASDENWRL